jgi:hypothetical protein
LEAALAYLKQEGLPDGDGDLGGGGRAEAWQHHRQESEEAAPRERRLCHGVTCLSSTPSS